MRHRKVVSIDNRYYDIVDDDQLFLADKDGNIIVSRTLAKTRKVIAQLPMAYHTIWDNQGYDLGDNENNLIRSKQVQIAGKVKRITTDA